MKRTVLAILGATGLALGTALLLPASASAGSAADSWSYQAALSPVTANMVTGTGASWITVTGTTAEIKIQVNGLLDGSPHAQHLTIGATGACPTVPQLHGGQASISNADGAAGYGWIGTSLTIDGETSPAAALALDQFPSAGSYTYSRTVELHPDVVANLQKGTAVLVVHGIDYNDNGSYDGVLGASDLDPSLTAEATDPALCGTFEPMQMAGVPDGAADTGGGSTAIRNVAAIDQSPTFGAENAAIAAGLVAAGLVTFGCGAVIVDRRRSTRD